MTLPLFQRLERQTAATAVPWHGFVEITRACNQRCLHCYHDNLRGPAMSLDLVRQSFDALARAGCLFLTISGGEPLGHPQFESILREAGDQGFAVSLLSNATLIDARRADGLAKSNLNSLAVTLFSAEAELHDFHTARPGSWRAAVRGIDLCRERGIRMEIRAPLLATTLAGWSGLESFCAARSLPLRPDPLLTPRTSGDRTPLTLQADDEETAVWLAARELLPLPDAADEDGRLFCDAGRNYLAIDAEGWILPCIQWPERLGHVVQDDLLRLWRESPRLQQIRSWTVEDLTDCRCCGYRGTCDRCPGLAWLEGGDACGPAGGCCRLARLRSVGSRPGP